MSPGETLVVVGALISLGLFAVFLALLLKRERLRHGPSVHGMFELQLIADQARYAMDEINRAAFIAMAECRLRSRAERHTKRTTSDEKEVSRDV